MPVVIEGPIDEWSHLTERIIGAAISVHTALGPGFQEGIYHRGLILELRSAGIHTSSQVEVPIFYRGVLLGKHRLDLIVASKVVLELKSVAKLDVAHFAQVRSYLAASDLPAGLLINFSGPKVECRRVYTPRGRLEFLGSRASRVPAPAVAGPTDVVRGSGVRPAAGS